MNTHACAHTHFLPLSLSVYNFWSMASYNPNAPFNYLCWECQRNLPFIYTVKSAADVCVLFSSCFLSFSVGISDISRFFFPLSFSEGIWKALGNGPLLPPWSCPQGRASHVALTGLWFPPAQKHGLDKLRPQTQGIERERKVSCAAWAQESSFGEGSIAADTPWLTAPMGTRQRSWLPQGRSITLLSWEAQHKFGPY